MSAMAEAYDVSVAPHCPLGPLALAACLQIAASTPNFVIQEMSLGIHYNAEGHDLLTYLTDQSVFDIADGCVGVPAGAGLGVSIDEGLVREMNCDPHSWRNPIWRAADGALKLSGKTSGSLAARAMNDNEDARCTAYVTSMRSDEPAGPERAGRYLQIGSDHPILEVTFRPPRRENWRTNPPVMEK